MKTKSEILKQALTDIVDPVGAMKRDLKDGYTLDGRYACQLSQDPHHLKQIAKDALDQIET